MSKSGREAFRNDIQLWGCGEADTMRSPSGGPGPTYGRDMLIEIPDFALVFFPVGVK